MTESINKETPEADEAPPPLIPRDQPGDYAVNNAVHTYAHLRTGECVSFSRSEGEFAIAASSLYAELGAALKGLQESIRAMSDDDLLNRAAEQLISGDTTSAQLFRAEAIRRGEAFGLDVSVEETEVGGIKGFAIGFDDHDGRAHPEHDEHKLADDGCPHHPDDEPEVRRAKARKRLAN